MTEEKQDEQNKEQIKEETLHEILSNPEVRERVNQEKEIFARRALFKHMVNNTDLDSLQHYRSVGSKQFEELKNNINSAKDNISELSTEQIENYEKKIKDAFELENSLENQLKNYQGVQVNQQSKISTKPKTLRDIYENPNLYEGSKVAEHTYGYNGASSTIYSTEYDDITYDSSRIGDWTKLNHAKYMRDNPLNDYSEMMSRNAEFQSHTYIN